MLNNLNMWNKIGRVVIRLSERLGIDLEKAFDLFYTSQTCKNLHDPQMALYLLSDSYIVDELIEEIRTHHKDADCSVISSKKQ